MNKMRPIRIAITGVESTGKSSLTFLLAQHFTCPFAREMARFDEAVVQNKVTLSDLTRLANEQLYGCRKAEQSAIADGRDFVISDSDARILEFWGKWVFHSLPVGLEEFREWPDFTLVCAPNIPWEADPLRSLPNFSDRQKLHTEIMHSFGKHQPWFLIDATSQQKRLEQAVRAVENFQKQHLSG